MINNLESLCEDIQNGDVSVFASKYKEDKFFDFKEFHPLLSSGKKNIEGVKKEFIADVSSFANTSGGYLIYGIREANRRPAAFTPFEIEDCEKLEIQLGQIMRAWLEPQVHGYKFSSIKMAKGKYVFVVSIPKSLNAPHAVKDPSKEYYLFYGRTNEGNKYPYKFSGIRNAFVQRENINDKIKLFRDHCINRVMSGDIILPLTNNGKIIIHIMPLSAFDRKEIYDIEKYYHDFSLITTIHHAHSGMTRRRNLDGILVHNTSAKRGQYYGYVQLHRNGIIEAVDSFILEQRHTYEDLSMIPSQLYEEQLIHALVKYMKALVHLGVQPPFYCALTFLGVEGFNMGVDRISAMTHGSPIDRDMLILPEFEINELAVSQELAATLLKQSFDLVWNACGREKSLNYNDQGEFSFPAPALTY